MGQKLLKTISDGTIVMKDRCIPWPKADDVIVPITTSAHAHLALSHADASRYYERSRRIGRGKLVQGDDGSFMIYAYAKPGLLRKWRYKRLTSASFSPDWRRKDGRLQLVGIRAYWS